MKDELLPGLDHALAGLLEDLDERGLLDETLVVCLSEHGRTPQIQKVAGGGRDHWAQVYSIALAGGGIARGRVIGRSDRIAGTVAERPISPKDILATIYHLLGFDPETTLMDRTARPSPLVANASILRDALA
jgi:arylsulfatase A-like enzyme